MGLVNTIQNKEKTKQLIIYISKKMCEEKSFGATVLNKTLYYIDNYSYLKNRNPISGFTYIKQDHGATPAPYMFMPLKKEMIDNGLIEEIQVPFFGRMQKRIVAKVEPKVNLFTPEEIALIDGIIDDLRSVNGVTISAINHQEIAWQFADFREELPYFTYLLTRAQIEDEDIKWAKTVVDEYEALRYS